MAVAVAAEDEGRLGGLVCPRCAVELTGEAGGLRCGRCQQDYPHAGGVPCLTPDPGLWRAQWRRRLAGYDDALAARVRQLRADAEGPGLLPRTRARIARVADALAHERARLADFAPLLASGEGGPGASAALNAEDQRAVVECDEHVFRDWVWGRAEVDGLRAFAEGLVPTGEALSTLAVYGAGAGRLAVDAHRSLGPARTFALDVNPLPLWAAARLLRGETLEIHELPLWPASDQDAVVLRRISYTEPVPPGFTFLIADALVPPFAAGSLDAVLTCWFIDAVPAALADVAARINRVLRPGGLWINAGPLRFQGSVARQLGIEEVHELVEGAGFALAARARAELPYFASPLGGTRALETVFGFAARKVAPAGAPLLGRAGAAASPSGLPAWLEDARLPVQATPAMARRQQSAIAAAGVISLVDGVRSLADIARIVADTWKAAPADVEAELRAFFAGLESE